MPAEVPYPMEQPEEGLGKVPSNTASSGNISKPIPIGQKLYKDARKGFIPKSSEEAQFLHEPLQAVSQKQGLESSVSLGTHETDASTSEEQHITHVENKKPNLKVRLGLSAVGLLGTLGIGGYFASKEFKDSGSGGSVSAVVVPNTPTLTPTETPTATPTPEIKDTKPFMPDAIRHTYIGAIEAVASDYPGRTQCPSPKVFNTTTSCEAMHEVVINPDIPNAEELQKEGIEEAYAVAWARTNKNMTLQDVVANYDKIVSEFKTRKANKEDVSITFLAYTDQSNYNLEGFVTLNPSEYKTEIDNIPLPNKYTPIQMASAQNYGFIVDKQRKIIHWVIYDYFAGGINDNRPQDGYPSGYYESAAEAWAGTILGDKRGQINGKYSAADITELLPLNSLLQKKFIPLKTSTKWVGVSLAR